MWHRKTREEILQIFKKTERKTRIHPLVTSFIIVVGFYAFFYVISAIERYFGWMTVREKRGTATNLLDVPISVFAAIIPIVAIFFYYAYGRDTDKPAATTGICFDCQESFSGFDRCPRCSGKNVSDIRFAEWRENKE